MLTRSSQAETVLRCTVGVGGYIEGAYYRLIGAALPREYAGWFDVVGAVPEGRQAIPLDGAAMTADVAARRRQQQTPAPAPIPQLTRGDVCQRFGWTEDVLRQARSALNFPRPYAQHATERRDAFGVAIEEPVWLVNDVGQWADALRAVARGTKL